MKDPVAAAAVLLLSVPAVPALGQSAAPLANYAKVGLAALSHDAGGLDDTLIPAAIAGVGRRINDWYSIEVLIGTGLTDGDAKVLGGAELGVEIDQMFGLYNKLTLYSAGSYEPYLSIGYTKGKTTISIEDYFTHSTSESDVSLGVGLNVCGKRLCGDLELVRYLNNDQRMTIDAFAASLVVKF